MILFTLAFLCGDWYLQTFSSLPSSLVSFLLLFFSFLLVLFLKGKGGSCFLFAALAGFCWSLIAANSVLSWVLPSEFEGKSVELSGYIASLPVTDRWQTHFLFNVDQFDQIKTRPVLIKLAWRKPKQPIKVGQKWRFQVILKRIHGLQNPGGFDYEAWSLQKGLRATGYIVSSKNQLLTHHFYHYPIQQIRQLLQERIEEYRPDSPSSHWLTALIMGERNDVPEEDWQVLRNTGTNHLMAIAGLHIGIIACFAHVLVSRLWRLFPLLMFRMPAQTAGAYGAFIVAVLYSALAGFSIPTVRACFMLTLFFIAHLVKRKVSAWQVWSCALFLMLLFSPLSILTESFWLSFGTIALIIYGMHNRLAENGWWWKWGRVQWVIGVGLIPLSLLLFQQGSLISFVANSIAIPWLGFFVLPFCFLSAIFLVIFPVLGGFFLWIADKSLGGLWILLKGFAYLPIASWHQAMPNQWIFGFSVLGILILLLPKGAPFKWLGVFWLLPLFLYQPPHPKKGDVRMTLLDVGQGLSVVVQTAKHLLIYDAGAKFNENVDMGESVVLPYLRTLKINRVDMLIVSHGDNDHMGGANAILNALPVATIKTSVPDKIPFSTYCLSNEAWEWDGVRFEFIYPTIGDLGLGNDSSCVLRIDNGGQRILLTGDIEKTAEKTLISTKSHLLSSDVIIAPHHGSKTSGLMSFINAVHPSVALYSTGYRNRYHFPHKTTTMAYTNIRAQQFNTAESGAIQLELQKKNGVFKLKQYRLAHKRYWMKA